MGTIREEIAELIRQKRLCANEISRKLCVQEKDVYHHLEHIARSAGGGEAFHVEPAVCLSCGFVFRDRKRLKRPGRCPRCRGERITRPSFFLESSLKNRGRPDAG